MQESGNGVTSACKSAGAANFSDSSGSALHAAGTADLFNSVFRKKLCFLAFMLTL